MTNNTLPATAAAYALAHETNGLIDHAAYQAIDRSLTLDLADPRLVRITRLRLLSDRGCPFWDLSYCHGEMADGTAVRVRLPRGQFRRATLKKDLIQMCKDAGRFGKGLGIFDAISTLD